MTGQNKKTVRNNTKTCCYFHAAAARLRGCFRWHWRRVSEEDVRCVRSWPASISLPNTREGLQTVRESWTAVYLHFSISSHSSPEFPMESRNQ